jgi:spore germination protein
MSRIITTILLVGGAAIAILAFRAYVREPIGGIVQDGAGARLVTRAWLPWWDFQRASSQAGDASFDELVLFTHILNSNLEVEAKIDNYDRHVSALAQNGSKIIASIYNEFDEDRLSRLLESKEEQERHIDDLLELISHPDISGLELDYEYMLEKDADAYVEFVNSLAGRVRAEGKTVAVTVHGKSSDEGLWYAAASQDWEQLGKAADSIVIMAYDYSWEGSDPGPIAPLSWVEEVVEYAEQKLPREKIILGVGAYGYDWTHDGDTQDMTILDVQALLEKTGASVSRDAASQGMVFSYTENGTTHEVWFEDAKAIGDKIKLAEESGIAGISIWRLGGVPDTIFGLLL